MNSGSVRRRTVSRTVGCGDAHTQNPGAVGAAFAPAGSFGRAARQEWLGWAARACAGRRRDPRGRGGVQQEGRATWHREGAAIDASRLRIAIASARQDHDGARRGERVRRIAAPPDPTSAAPARAAATDTHGVAGTPRRPARRSLCLRAPLVLLVIGAALLGSPRVAHAQTAPTVDSVSVVSDPGADDTYGLNDTITVAVEFTAAVTVTGTPQITLRVGGGAAVNLKLANYASGSGTTTLRFSYVVQAMDMDDNGIYLEANELVLNGGTIQSADGVAAVLTYSAEGQQNGHKVDGSLLDTTPPALDSATVAADGTAITLVFDEDLSNPYITLGGPHRLQRDRRRQHRHHREPRYW